MTAKKFNSEANEAIHSAASGLYKAGVIGKKTMREYDTLAIAPAPAFDPSEIRLLREKNKVSQPVFAGYLNVTKSTVEKWESGAKSPSGSALKLLSIIKKHGLKLLEEG